MRSLPAALAAFASFAVTLAPARIAPAQAAPAEAAPAPGAPAHGSLPASLRIANVHVIRGDRTPPYGPTDVIVRDGRIVHDGAAGPAKDVGTASVIDGTGCWLLPGLVSTHAHLQEQ